MLTTRKAVRFRERSELLDFLLEVSTVTSQTLDLDELLANVSEIVKRVIPGELFAILLYSEKRRELRIRYALGDRKSTRLNSSHLGISYAVFCLKKKTSPHKPPPGDVPHPPLVDANVARRVS